MPRRSLAWGAVLILLSSLVAGLLVVTRSGEPRPDADAEVPPAVLTALAFAQDVSAADAAERARAVGRWVVPSRVPRFVEAFHADGTSAGRGGPRVRSEAYRVLSSSPGLVEVLVWGRSAAVAPSGGERGRISRYGVILQSGRWWVYSYSGTIDDVAADDRRLRDFVRLG